MKKPIENQDNKEIKKISSQIRYNPTDQTYSLINKDFNGKPAIQWPCAKWAGDGPLGAAHRSSSKIKISAGLNRMATIFYEEEKVKYQIELYYGSGEAYWSGKDKNILTMTKEEIGKSTLLTPMGKFIFDKFIELKENSIISS